MPVGPGKLLKLRMDTNIYTCICCSPLKKTLRCTQPGDDGT